MNLDLGNNPSGFPPSLSQKEAIRRQLRVFTPDLEGGIQGASAFSANAYTAPNVGMFKQPYNVTSVSLGGAAAPVTGSFNAERLSQLVTGDLLSTTTSAWQSLNFRDCSNLEVLYFGHPTSDAATGFVNNLDVGGCSSLSTISGRGVNLSGVSVDFAGLSSLDTVVLRGTKLTADQVDDIIITLDAIGNSNGYLYLSGTANVNAAPTAASSASLYQLTGVKNWVYVSP